MTSSLVPAIVFSCLTCGYAPTGGKGMIVHGENLTTREALFELGHTDSAHEPNWVVDADPATWEAVDVGELEVDDVLATGETVTRVREASEDFDWEQPDNDQVWITTDQRGPVKVGWPGRGGSKIIRRVR